MSVDVVELERAAESLLDDWREVAVAEVVAMLPGFAFKSENFVTDTDAGLPLIRIRDLCLTNIAIRYVGDYDEAFAVREGDILVGMDGAFEAVRWRGGKALLNQRVLKLSIARPDAIDEGYLFYRVQPALSELEQTISGTTVKHLSTKDLKRLVWKLPPLDEQRRMAEVLRSVDEAIAVSKATIEQAQCTSRGLLQRLFVEGLEHSDFKEGHTTSIPTSWDERSLSDLSAIPITYGVVQPGPNVPNGVPLIRGGDFPNGKIDINGLRTISPELAGQYRRTQLVGGEVLVSLVGYPGACAVVPNELAGANVNRAVAVMRPTDAVTSEYLYHFLRSPVAQARLKKETIGSAQRVINLRDLKEVFIGVPPLREQQQIAAILGDLDDFVELENANLSKLTALKVSLSADLLSGLVRVPA